MNPLARLPLYQVFGPLWPFWSTLGVTLALVSLMFVIAAWGGSGVRPELLQFMGLATGLVLLAVACSGITRMAKQERVWLQRLAPSKAQRRLRQAAAAGLALAWLCALPTLLLAATIRDGAFPLLAGLAVQGLLLCAAVALAGAWQGSLPWLLALPGLLVVVSLFALGSVQWWTQWLALPTGVHLALACLGPPLAFALVMMSRSSPRIPAQVLRQSLGRRIKSWRQRHQYLHRQGESVLSFWAWLFFWQSLGWIHLEQSGLLGFLHVALVMGLLILMVWNLLLGPALHWRYQLAPSRWQRAHLGWLIVSLTLRHHAAVAPLLLASVGAAMALIDPDSLSNWVAKLPTTGATFVARWVQAILLVTWLRGLGLRTWPLVGRAAVALAAIAGAHAALLSVLGVALLASWAVTALTAVLLLRPIQRAWTQRDLSDYLPRAKPESAG